MHVCARLDSESLFAQVEKRAISAAEGYYASLQALDTERNELRGDLHESHHALSEVLERVVCALLGLWHYVNAGH